MKMYFILFNSCLFVLSGCYQKRSYSVIDTNAINESLDSLLGIDLTLQAEQLGRMFPQKSELDSFMFVVVNNNSVGSKPVESFFHTPDQLYKYDSISYEKKDSLTYQISTIFFQSVKNENCKRLKGKENCHDLQKIKAQFRGDFSLFGSYRASAVDLFIYNLNEYHYLNAEELSYLICLRYELMRPHRKVGNKKFIC